MSRCVTWPREVVYTIAGKLVVYDDISLALFMRRYMISDGRGEVSSKTVHGSSLIRTDGRYRSVWVGQRSSISAVWLQQLEQVRLTRED